MNNQKQKIMVGILFMASLLGGFPPQPISAYMGWEGTPLIEGETLENWSVENDAGATGNLQTEAGVIGQSVGLHWDLDTGSWVQAVYTFPNPMDLAQADIFGVHLRGGGEEEIANRVAFMFSDDDGNHAVHNVPFGVGVNRIDRWMMNLPLPKKSFNFGWGPGTEIDWSQIKRFYIVLKKPYGDPSNPGGGEGLLRLDHLQWDRAADWPRQTDFETVSPSTVSVSKAVDYIISQQDLSTGLFVSWKEEEVENPPVKSWLYDQALSLIILTREGTWGPQALNSAAEAADRLATFFKNNQKSDGRWARAWETRTGVEWLVDDWVGDQAWGIMALSIYAKKAHDADAMEAALRGISWLSPKIDLTTGNVASNTEGNVDAWWALMSTFQFSNADKVRDYLLTPGELWDPDLRYWWIGENGPYPAMDAATWTSFFARHSRVGEPERGKEALSFVKRVLATESDDGVFSGMDGIGPLSLWYEGMGQYVAAGGEGSQEILNTLFACQRQDGSMPGSSDDWNTSLVWLSPWSGLAATSWFYFAQTGAPFLDVPVPFEASSDSGGASLAFDGDMTTRWGSDFSDPQWISQYFGTKKTINKVIIHWETAYAKSYRLQISEDGESWSDIYETTNGDGGEDVVYFNSVETRYLRMYGTERGTPWGYSIWEMSAEYDEAVIASSEDSVDLSALNAFDGDPETRWSSNHSDPQWIQIDLSEPQLINRVEIDWETAYAKSYQVQVSLDGTSWTDVFSTTEGDGEKDIIPFAKTEARYVRIYGTERGTIYGYSIFEILISEEPAFFASSDSGGASLAFDGDMETRWGSDFSDPQWITQRFDTLTALNKVVLDWETAYGKEYKIQVSKDGLNWVDVFSTSEGNGNQDIIPFERQDAWYLRMYGTERGTPWGYSLWEMKGELEATVTASSEENTSLSAGNAFDGDPGTRWGSDFSDPQWLTVHFDQEKLINKVVLNWEGAYGEEYKIQVSTDGVSWQDVFFTSTGDGGIDLITFDSVSARYVRVYGTERGTPYGYSLWEIEIDYDPFASVESHLIDNGGDYSAMVLDHSNLPHIVYHDGQNDRLVYTLWDGSSWIQEEISSGGGRPFLSLDINGEPHVVYLSGTLLKYAHRVEGVWEIEDVFTSGEAHISSISLALAFGTDPRVAYRNELTNQLELATWTGGVWSVETVDSGGWFASMAIDSLGQPHVLYSDVSGWALRHAVQKSTGWEISQVDGFSISPQISIKGNGDLAVSYFDYSSDALAFAEYENGLWNKQVIDNDPEAIFPGRESYMALDDTGNPHLFYVKAFPNSIKEYIYARCEGNTWTSSVLPWGWTGYLATDIAGDGKGHFTFQDINDNDHLKHITTEGSLTE